MIATMTCHTLTAAASMACQLHSQSPVGAAHIAALPSASAGTGTITLLIVVVMVASVVAVAGAARLAAALLTQFLQVAANIASTLFTLVILAVVVVTLAVHH